MPGRMSNRDRIAQAALEAEATRKDKEKTAAKRKAKQYLKRALEEPTGLAHQVASEMHRQDRRFDQAIAEAEAGIALDPNDANSYVTLAGVLIMVGRAKEAADLTQKAMRLDPHYPAFYLYVLGVASYGEERYAKAAEYLARVGLEAYGRKFPHQLSGGEQQRVALARALAPKPRVMLMDEPFSGLDNRLRDEVRDHTLSILKEEGAGVLLVTHDPDEAMRMADRIALMREGKIVQIGAPYHVYNYPVDREAAGFFSDLNIIHSVVRDRQTDTPFGLFLTPTLVDDADVEIVIRPQHLRIEPDELRQLLTSEGVALFDLRNALAIEVDPRRIPGAQVMSLEDLDARHEEIPRDREIVLYCS